MRIKYLLILLILLIVTARPVVAAKTDAQLVRDYCRKYYPTYKVRIVPFDSPLLGNRKGKRVVYVERIVSQSVGEGRGKIAGKWTITYNKRVRKGKRVVSYCIWNPRNNYCDDVVAVVDNRKIR